MTFAEFTDLKGEAQIAFLNNELAVGKSPEEIYVELGATKLQISEIGIVETSDRFELSHQ